MTPREATTQRKIIALKEDNYPRSDDVWSIVISTDHVSLHPPGGGEYVCIPRDQFNDIVDWYGKDQTAETGTN